MLSFLSAWHELLFSNRGMDVKHKLFNIAVGLNTRKPDLHAKNKGADQACASTQSDQHLYCSLCGRYLDKLPSMHMTSKQRRCDVMTSHRRWYDVVSRLCACWVAPRKIAIFQLVSIAWYTSICLTLSETPDRFSRDEVQ